MRDDISRPKFKIHEEFNKDWLMNFDSGRMQTTKRTPTTTSEYLLIHQTSSLSPKKQDLWPKIKILKKKTILCEFNYRQFVKKCKNLIFRMKN